jgi:hypothetical protein
VVAKRAHKLPRRNGPESLMKPAPIRGFPGSPPITKCLI